MVAYGFRVQALIGVFAVLGVKQKFSRDIVRIASEYWKPGLTESLKLKEFPSDVSQVIIDIGTNYRSSFLAKVKFDPSVFLVGIDPIPDLIANHMRNDRVWLVNAAIVNNISFGEIRYSDFSLHTEAIACSTLLHGNSFNLSLISKEDRKFVNNCFSNGGNPKRFRVPIVALSTLLSFIPWADYPNLTITILKADCQGLDLSAVLSVGNEFLGSRRVKRVMMEVVNAPLFREIPDFHLFPSTPVLSDIQISMARRGYVLERCETEGRHEPNWRGALPPSVAHRAILLSQDCVFLNAKYYADEFLEVPECFNAGFAMGFADTVSLVLKKEKTLDEAMKLFRNSTPHNMEFYSRSSIEYMKMQTRNACCLPSVGRVEDLCWHPSFHSFEATWLSCCWEPYLQKIGALPQRDKPSSTGPPWGSNEKVLHEWLENGEL